ncbi:MAG: vWA domain-containing protein, partial [Bacteroidota bacterium]
MQTVTEILIDYSTSMKGDRLNICKRMLLEEILPAVDYSDKIGIKTFSASRSKVPSIIERQSLRSTNKKELTNTVNNLDTPSGNTPIAAAIKSSLDNLKRYRSFKKKVILITDGEENCNGDYEAEAQRTVTEELDCEIHVIGLGLEEKATEKAVKIAAIAGGTFSNLDISTYDEYDSELVHDTLSDFIEAVKKPESDTTTEKVDVKEKRISTKAATEPSLKPDNSIRNGAKKSVKSELTESSQVRRNGEKAIKERREVAILEKAQPTNVKSKETDTNAELLKAITDELQSLRTEIQVLKSSNQLEESQEEEEKSKVGEYEEVLVEEEEVQEESPNEDEIVYGEVMTKSEKYVLDSLKAEYGERVRWLNEETESKQSHDFE